MSIAEYKFPSHTDRTKTPGADEGQIWEAAQFAAHDKMDNLICFVDDNKNQLDGPVNEIMSHGKGLGA